MKQLIAVISVAMLLVGISVTVSSGGVKKIQSEQFILYPNFTASHTIGPLYLASGSATVGVTFYSMVKLPVGGIIKKLTFYYYGYTATNSPYASVNLYRQKMGEGSEYIGGKVVSNVVTEITLAETTNDKSFLSQS